MARHGRLGRAHLGRHPRQRHPWGQVIGTGSAGWFLSTGGSVAVDGVVVGVVPLLGWALAAWFTAYQLRHISAHTGEVSRRLLPRFLGGYAAAAALVALLTWPGRSDQPWPD
ncbi:MAG: hypothetical protein IPJ15_00040 [Actinomycetales bacterium]|nr:hypothetical protein [Candidatus Phosphoribacter baldrii]